MALARWTSRRIGILTGGAIAICEVRGDATPRPSMTRSPNAS
jgi:hypothetical protein